MTDSMRKWTLIFVILAAVCNSVIWILAVKAGPFTSGRGAISLDALKVTVLIQGKLFALCFLLWIIGAWRNARNRRKAQIL
jgi:hypothetical protein